MADKRLIDFNEKPLPAGDDIVYIGDQSDLYRENRTTLDQFNSFKGFLEVSANRDVLFDLLGKNIVSDSVTAIVLSIQLNPAIPVGSQFVMIRNTAGTFDLQAVAGVTINGVDAGIIEISDQHDRAVITNISNNEWTVSKYSSNFTGTPERVAITNASGEITTSEFLKYIPVTEVLESNAIITNSIQSLGPAKIFPSQNVVNSDRALDQQDLGVMLSNGSVGKINLPAAGDITLPTSASFYIWEPSAIPLTVQAPAGVLLNGVDGGSVVTSGSGSIITVVRNVLSSDSWHSTTSTASVPTYQEIFDNDATATTQLAEGKDLVFKSFEESLSTLTSIVSGGSGYTVGDILTVAGGTFTEPASLRASIVSAGAVTQALIVEDGVYTVLPTNPAAVTGGSGVGAEFNLYFEKKNFVKHKAITSITGGLSVGNSGFVPNYAIAHFGNVSGDERGVLFPRTDPQAETRMLEKLPLNGLLWYSNSVGRFRTSIANIVRTMPIEQDITLENAYTQGDGKIDLISEKPLVLNSTTAGSRDPEMTVAQFNAIAIKINGEKAFASDTQRPIIETSAGVKQFAYTDDIPVGVTPGYGEMYFNDNTTETAIVNPATPVKVAGTYVSGLLSEFTHSGSGAMIYTGSSDTFKLSVSLSCTLNLSSGSVSAIIYQNGLPVSKSKQQSDLGPTSPGAQNISCMALVSLATNDSVEIFIQNDSGSENIIVTQLSCIPEELAGGAGSGPNVVTAWNGSTAPVAVTAGTDIDISAGVISYNGTQESNIVTSWDGSTAPVAVTAGTDIDISSGVISYNGTQESNVVTSWDGSTAPVSVTSGTDIDISAGVISYNGTQESNIVTSWDGSTSPVAVTAGINVNIDNGIISVPDYGASVSDVIIFDSSGFANFNNLGVFTTKSGLNINVVKDLEVQCNDFISWIELDLGFISSFSSPVNKKEVAGDVAMITRNTSISTDNSKLIDMVPIPGTTRVRFSFRSGAVALPEQYVLRFNFTYPQFPL